MSIPGCARLTIAAVVAVAVASPLDASAQELTTPPDWRWRLDGPAQLVTAQPVSDSTWQFVGMPPGWHVTTGPGVVLYHPAERANGRYSLSSDFVLFPNPAESPYGLVLGGPDLSSASAPSIAVQLRRDGAVRIVAERDGNEQVLAPWRTHAAIKPHPGTGTVTNRLRVGVAPDSVRVFVNDSAIVAVPASGLQLDGQYGFGIGARLNMHITTLDYTRHLAPSRGR
jgi:hypothetical protein